MIPMDQYVLDPIYSLINLLPDDPTDHAACMTVADPALARVPGPAKPVILWCFAIENHHFYKANHHFHHCVA